MNARWLELLPLRFVAGGFLVGGVATAVGAVVAPASLVPDADAPSFGWRIVFVLGGALYVAIGIGILARSGVCRVMGAFFSGLPAGVALAIIVVGYGPWSGMAWDRGLATAVVLFGLSGFQLWVLTNPVAHRYCSK